MDILTRPREITCSSLSAQSGIQHGFFTRQGGISQGVYASLNCGYGSGDDLEAVSENRTQIAACFTQPKEALCTAYQIHSANAVTLSEAWEWEDAPEADGLVTNVPGIILGILTADCVPVLFADATHKVIGAAHAGWKGAIGGILEATLAQMEALGATPQTMVATIGPAIAQASYEVSQEFYDRFTQHDPDNHRYFNDSARKEHFMFDLKAYVQNRLAKTKLSRVSVLPQDTCSQDSLFFSYRRTCLQKESHYGRQMSAIMLTK